MSTSQNEEQEQRLNEQITWYTWAQAVGTNIQAIGQQMTLSRNEAEQQEGNNLIIIGNIIQSAANVGQTEATLRLNEFVDDPTINTWNAFGSLLQAIGNAIQAVTTEP